MNEHTKCADTVPVYEFRPILDREYGGLFRYAEGKWIVDDGKYDIAFAQPDNCMAYGVSIPYRPNILWSWVKNSNWSAFVSEHPDSNAWHYMLRDGETEWGNCWQRDLHLNVKAMDKAMSFTCRRRGCANGRGPEFHINDPYITKGLLRLRDTKEIVKFPDIFNCMYCGEIDWHKVEQAIAKAEKS